MFQTLLMLKWIFRRKSSSRTRNFTQKETHDGSFLRSPENSDQSTGKPLFTKNEGLISMTAIWLKLDSTKNNVYIWMWMLMLMWRFPNGHCHHDWKARDFSAKERSSHNNPSDNPTLFIGFGRDRSYVKSRFMLQKVNFAISKVKDSMIKSKNFLSLK